MKPSKKTTQKSKSADPKRKYLSQKDVPTFSILEALRVAQGIASEYGSNPTSPLLVAKALDTEPSGSTFRMLTGASIAYGLTEGGYNADKISLTPLGRRIVKPTIEGDDIKAKREAFLRPNVIRSFLEYYKSSPLPRDEIAVNVLETMGVPKDKAVRTLQLITEGAKELGLLEEIKGKFYPNLSGVDISSATHEDAADELLDATPSESKLLQHTEPNSVTKKTPDPVPQIQTSSKNRRVFITHGRNKAFIEPIDLLHKCAILSRCDTKQFNIYPRQLLGG